MPTRDIESRLYDAMAAMPIIDAHEHVMWESERLKADVDALTLFHHYTRTDLRSAGMDQDWAWGKLHDPEIPLDERWKAGSFRHLMPDFRKRGLVEVEGRTIRILKPDELQQVR